VTEPVTESATESATEPVAKTPFHRRLTSAAKVIAGVVGFAATIFGVYVAVKDRPAEFTMTDWSRSANVVCDKDFGTLQVPVYQALPVLAQALAQQPVPGVPNENLDKAGQTMLALSSTFRNLAGDLRSVAPPPSYHGSDIDALLKASTDISDMFGQFAFLLTNYQMGTATPDQMGAAVQSLQTATRVTMPAFADAATKLGLTQCLGFVGHGSVAPPTPN
jgi:hypothetical protein